jgi:hypothetical protein
VRRPPNCPLPASFCPVDPVRPLPTHDKDQVPVPPSSSQGLASRCSTRTRESIVPAATCCSQLRAISAGVRAAQAVPTSQVANSTILKLGKLDSPVRCRRREMPPHAFRGPHLISGDVSSQRWTMSGPAPSATCRLYHTCARRCASLAARQGLRPCAGALSRQLNQNLVWHEQLTNLLLISGAQNEHSF